MLMDAVKPADLQATRVLSLDAAGRILDWISWQDAVCLYVRDVVAWTLGDPCLTVHGGHNRALGTQSLLQLHPILASTGPCREQDRRSGGSGKTRAVRLHFGARRSMKNNKKT